MPTHERLTLVRRSLPSAPITILALTSISAPFRLWPRIPVTRPLLDVIPVTVNAFSTSAPASAAASTSNLSRTLRRGQNISVTPSRGGGVPSQKFGPCSR